MANETVLPDAVVPPGCPRNGALVNSKFWTTKFLDRHSRAAVLLALPPIALGHALSIAIVAGAFVMAGLLVDPRAVQIAAGLLLIGWAVYHQLYGHKHRVRVGMTAGLAGWTMEPRAYVAVPDDVLRGFLHPEDEI